MLPGLRTASLALLFGLFLLPSAAFASFDRPLFLGSEGADVSALQTFLKEKGFYAFPEITGSFGSITQAALAAYQASVGLEAVGQVGSRTLALLNGSTAPSSSLSTLITSLQQLLRNAGYYQVELTGNLDQATLEAVQSISSGTNVAPKRSGGKPQRSAEEGEIVVSDTAPPVLSAIASSTGTTTATITWTTDELADSRVDLGPTTSYGTASTSATFSTFHSLTFTGLTASTTYHFRVQSQDMSGNAAVSTDQTFATVPAWTGPSALDYLRFDVTHAPKLFNGPSNVADGISDFRVVMMGHSIPQAYRSNSGAITTLQDQYGGIAAQAYSSLVAGALATALNIPFRTSAWFGDAAGSTSTNTSTSNNGSTARYRADTRVGVFSVGTGNWIGQSGTRLGGNRLRNIASTNRIRFTDSGAVDTAEIYYGLVASGGSFNVAVANGSAIGSSTDSTGTDGGVAVKSVALGSRAVQSVDAWRASGSFDLLGMLAYDSTIKQGIMVNAARQGSTVAQWNTPEAIAELGLINPDAVFVQLDLNEWLTGVAPATFSADYQSWITSVKALPSAPDIVLVVSSTPNPATVTTYPWSDYRDAVYELAEDNNLPLIDLGGAIGYDYANAVSSGFINTNDGLHWLASFHSHAASELADRWAAGIPD